MSPEDIQSAVGRNLDHLPQAVGVNNHMGSRFTEDEPAMEAALSAIRDRGLFFLDSLTTPRSQAGAVAKKLGMRHFTRDIFLDNVRTPEAIALQLKKGEAIARRTGLAIVIGHPHLQTLQALRVWSAQRDTGISLVRLSSLP